MEDVLLNRFLEYLAVEKGLSRNTVQSYERDLRRYMAFMKKKDADAVAQTDVVSFLSRLSDAGLATPSVARCLAVDVRWCAAALLRRS